MMICKYCGCEIKEGWKVCTNCGGKVEEDIKYSEHLALKVIRWILSILSFVIAITGGVIIVIMVPLGILDWILLIPTFTCLIIAGIILSPRIVKLDGMPVAGKVFFWIAVLLLLGFGGVIPSYAIDAILDKDNIKQVDENDSFQTLSRTQELVNELSGFMELSCEKDGASNNKYIFKCKTEKNDGMNYWAIVCTKDENRIEISDSRIDDVVDTLLMKMNSSYNESSKNGESSSNNNYVYNTDEGYIYKKITPMDARGITELRYYIDKDKLVWMKDGEEIEVGYSQYGAKDYFKEDIRTLENKMESKSLQFLDIKSIDYTKLNEKDFQK